MTNKAILEKMMRGATAADEAKISEINSEYRSKMRDIVFKALRKNEEFHYCCDFSIEALPIHGVIVVYLSDATQLTEDCIYINTGQKDCVLEFSNTFRQVLHTDDAYTLRLYSLYIALIKDTEFIEALNQCYIDFFNDCRKHLKLHQFIVIGE
jgi:hypothetical protein